jgi:uncharacterized cupredoxin-like copper-binding protein
MTAKTGSVEFNVKNDGTLTHEFVVVRGNDYAALPTAANGSVDEEKIAPADQVGEIEDIEAGQSKSATFDLSAGSYLLFCNVVEKATGGAAPVSHFNKGMHAPLTVKD